MDSGDQNSGQSPASRSDPLLWLPTSLNDFCYQITDLQDLARQGSWRPILEKVSHARKLALLQQPHEHLAYLAYNVLALAKLRRYGDAMDELSTMEDFDSPQYKYESHPMFYSGKSGSMVPFSLRWLRAQLPYRIGKKKETLDRLYELLDFVESKIAQSQSVNKVGAQSIESAKNELGTQSLNSAESPKTQSLDSTEPPKTVVSSNTETLSSPVTANPEGDAGVSVNPVGIDGTGSFVDSSVTPFNSVNNVPDGQVGDGAIPIESLTLDEPHSETGHVGTLDQKMSIEDLPVVGSQDVDIVLNKVDEVSHEFDQKLTLESKTDDQFCALSTSLGRWRRREEIVISSIVGYHLSQKEYNIAMKWMEKLLQKNPSDPFLLSKLGQIQMQLGDLNGAKNTFSRIEALVNQGQVPTSSLEGLKNMVNRNRGLQHLVAKDYTAAIREYEEALDRDPADVVATNNKALCLMYSRDLLGSIKVLENSLEIVPVIALNENVVLNLCSMYELAFVSNVETKRSLSSWIVQIAPEDFDLSCTRL